MPISEKPRTSKRRVQVIGNKQVAHKKLSWEKRLYNQRVEQSKQK